MEEHLAKIEENYNKVAENILMAADGRKVDIVGATKDVDVDTIGWAYRNLKFLAMAENKAQDFTEKYKTLSDINWHFIGALQTNKVKYLVGKVDIIHSVDRLELVEEIAKKAKQYQSDGEYRQGILIQINAGLELSKSGMAIDDLKPFIDNVLDNYYNIDVRGLMAVFPKITIGNGEVLYKKVGDKFLELKQYYKALDFDYMSCGMSSDYEMAIKYANSNIVRIGQAIFASRKYQ